MRAETKILPALEVARVALDGFMKTFGAKCCTFYIRDSWWADEFRLVLMPGVTHKEPMHGFMSSGTLTKMALKGAPYERFFKHARESKELREKINDQLRGLINRNRLFGDFIEREGVVSCVRFVHQTRQGEPDSLLFINFDRSVDYINKLQHSTRQLATRLFALVSKIQREQKISFPIQELLRILHPISQLATFGLEQPDNSNNLSEQSQTSHDAFEKGRQSELENHFQDILEAALVACGLDPKTSVGTIHLLDPNGGILNIAGVSGHLDHSTRLYDVSKGEGIISWVVHRRRSIMIADVEKSDFGKDIYVKIRNGVRERVGSANARWR